MWSSIDKTWQLVFELGWESYRNGSIPIGAVVCDEFGNVISTGRNRTLEKTNINAKMAHAEMEALQNIDIVKYPNLHSYTLYTSMEPCPMCMGSIIMSNIRKLRIIARDTYAGATHLCKIDPYISSKNIEITFEGGKLEKVTLVLQTYFELHKSNGQYNNFTEALNRNSPESFKIAKILFSDRYLDKLASDGVSFKEIFNKITEFK